MADTLTQLPAIVDIAFVAGDSFRMRVRILDGTSTPVSLDQVQFCAEIAQMPSRAVVAQFEVARDPAYPTTAVILSLSPTETAVLPGMGDGLIFEGVWDLEVTFPGGDVRTPAKGAVLCEIDVSNCSTWVPVAATSALAGSPGIWQPVGSTPPFSVQALQANPLPASPNGLWTPGQYVQTGTPGPTGWAYWNGNEWKIGRAP